MGACGEVRAGLLTGSEAAYASYSRYMAAEGEALNVCIVSRAVRVHGIGGMQDHTEDLAVGLARAGHDVTVITARHPQGITEERRDGVTWTYVDADGTTFLAKDWRARSLEAFRQADGRRPFDVVHGQGSSALEFVRRGVERVRPGVVAFHGNYRSIVAANLRRQWRARSIRALVREQRALVDKTRGHYALGNWWRFRRCEAIVPSHQELVATCWSHRLRADRVTVIPNGVDTNLFRPLRAGEPRVPPSGLAGVVFAYAGRLNRAKGVDDAIRALAQVRSHGADVSLLILGDGDERAFLEDSIHALRLEDRVHLTGAVGRRALAAYLAAADAFIYPSRHNEAAPLALRQAMAAGLPLLATAVGGVPELVGGQDPCGVLVPPEDNSALAEGIALLARDPALRSELGRSGRARAVDEYQLDLMVERTVAVYSRAIARLEEAEAARAAVSHRNSWHRYRAWISGAPGQSN